MSKTNAKTNMIRSRLKLISAALLLLILRNGVFGEVSINCFVGIKIDGKDGYNGKRSPESTLCEPDRTCLRIGIDEIESESGSKSQLICF